MRFVCQVVYSATAMHTYPRIGSLAGIILRKHVAVLLARKAFHAGMISPKSTHVRRHAKLMGHLHGNFRLAHAFRTSNNAFPYRSGRFATGAE